MAIPALRVESLAFRRPGGFALAIPSLVLGETEQALVEGPSGCGKSTLLHLVAGLEEADAGSIVVAGTDVCCMHGAARDRFRGSAIGMVFQTFNLLSGFSAEENVRIAMSMAGARDEGARARQLLARLGIDAPAARVENLSVGQQQRVAVARALACSPRLVLADEPTASLDPAHATAAIDLLQSACRDAGAALLCASHDPAVAARFSRRISLTSNGVAHG